MTTDFLHLPRLLFWLQFTARERQTVRLYLLLFCVLVFFMCGGPADLEQSGNGGLLNSARFATVSKSAQLSHAWIRLWRSSVCVHERLPRHRRRLKVTKTYGFGNRPKGSDPEIHGDPRTIPSLVHKAAALYLPVFAEVLLSTSIRRKRHSVWVPNAAQMEQ